MLPNRNKRMECEQIMQTENIKKIINGGEMDNRTNIDNRGKKRELRRDQTGNRRVVQQGLLKKTRGGIQNIYFIKAH